MLRNHIVGIVGRDPVSGYTTVETVPLLLFMPLVSDLLAASAQSQGAQIRRV
jgi:hypothetical protein